MVSAHASFVAVLMTVVPLYGTAPSGTTSLQTRLHKRECSEPLMEEVRFCGNLRIWRYFYNHTSQQCHQFYWDNCLTDGVHMTRIDCAKKCNLKEQPEICAEHPAGTCATYQPTSSYYPKKSYFYNITSKRCEEYKVCMSTGYILKQNSFASKTLCIMHCRGFGRHGIAKRELLAE